MGTERFLLIQRTGILKRGCSRGSYKTYFAYIGVKGGNVNHCLKTNFENYPPFTRKAAHLPQNAHCYQNPNCIDFSDLPKENKTSRLKAYS